MNNGKAAIIVGAIIVLAIAMGVLCIGWMRQPTPAPALNPCVINPTRTTATGEWVEHDGEPLDEDPCDSDDLTGKHKPGSSKSPKPQTTRPAIPTAKQPAPARTTRRP